MIPRSVLQNKKKCRQLQKLDSVLGNEMKASTSYSSTDINVNIVSERPEAEESVNEITTKIAKEVLTDIIEKCSSENDPDKENKTCSDLSIQMPISKAIAYQANPPLVDVGPLAPSNCVPVYKRCRDPTKTVCGGQGKNFLRGLAWEPHNIRSSKPSRREKFADYQGRRWDYTDAGRYYMQRPEKQKGFTFTVMSYNVLAQELLEIHSNMYFHATWEILDWQYRSQKLLQELKHHLPDVVCLQEVQHNHYTEFFLPELQALGYDGVYLKRTADKPDGCATFYKKEKFKKQQVIEVPYLHKFGGNVLDRDNVGLIVKLSAISRTVPPDKSLVIANTHLLFNPRRGDVKLAQLMMLFAEIDKCAHSEFTYSHSQYHPAIVCGDFNSIPHSELYKLIVMGFLEYEGISCRDVSGQEPDSYYRCKTINYLSRDFMPPEVGISDGCQFCEVVRSRTCDTETIPQGTGLLRHNLRLVSVYQHWCRRHGRYFPEVSTHHGKSSCTVDYIFYGVLSGLTRFYNGEVQTKDVQEGHLSLLARLGLLTERELSKMGSLPNKHFGSDHLSLIAMFLLT